MCASACMCVRVCASVCMCVRACGVYIHARVGSVKPDLDLGQVPSYSKFTSLMHKHETNLFS